MPQTTTPNGDFGVDSMISVLAHELAETGSDPLINAWMDSAGEENGDKCAWNFGALSTAANGAYYNEQVATVLNAVFISQACFRTHSCMTIRRVQLGKLPVFAMLGQVGPYKFLIQQNWDPIAQTCEQYVPAYVQGEGVIKNVQECR